jgi:hypothetical protein
MEHKRIAFLRKRQGKSVTMNNIQRGIEKMVKHIILWQLRDEFDEEQKREIAIGIKQGLEGLKGKIPGLLDVQVNIDCLDSSNADVMLDSSFVDENALKGYAVHPDHVAVADSKVRPYTATRVCMDYELK